MPELSPMNILILLSCMMTIMFGIDTYTQKLDMVVVIVLVGLGTITTIACFYFILKPYGIKCDKCNGTGELPPKTCKECGRKVTC